MTILTYADFYNNMGAAPEPMMVNAIWQWPKSAWVGMSRLHGDGLSTVWSESAQPGGAGGPSNPNYATLTTTPWEDITGWFAGVPAVANTCTNAGVKVWDFQLQYFDITTQSWKLFNSVAASGYRDAKRSNINWWTTDTFTSDGAATRFTSGRSNLPSFCCTKLNADMAAADPLPHADWSKYRIVHNAIPRVTADYSILGGIAVMCKAKIEAVPGTGALNGDPHIYLQIGADGWPRAGLIANSGILSGITNMPSIGGSSLKKLTTSEQVFLYVTSSANPATVLDTTSPYIAAHPTGPYPFWMSAATLQANVPQFKTF